MCLPQSRFEPQQMFDELLAIVRSEIADGAAAATGRVDPRPSTARRCSRYPAARRHHHAFVGRAAGAHAERDADRASTWPTSTPTYYPDMQPPLDKGLVVAGAILHDIGKLRELDQQPADTSTRPPGR